MLEHTVSLNDSEYQLVQKVLELVRKYGQGVVEQISDKVAQQEIVADLYRNDKITFNQAHDLFNHSTWQETAKVLEGLGCELYYDEDDLNNDRVTLQAFRRENPVKCHK